MNTENGSTGGSRRAGRSGARGRSPARRRGLSNVGVPFVVLAAVAAACGGDDDSTESSDRAEVAGQGTALADEESPHLEAALDEGEVTWYTAHYSSETADNIAALFEETYPGIEVNLYRETAQRIYQRFVQEAESGQGVADVLGITEISLQENLADEGLLEPFSYTDASNINPDYSQYDHPDGYYRVATVGNNVLCYNTDEVSEDEAPHQWEDLLDPKWEGQIATGHPGASGYVGTWATHMYLEYGEEYFDQLGEQDVLIGQSVTDTLPRLAAGERLVAACSDQTAATSIEAGDPVGIVYPEDGAVIMPTPNSIPTDAPHPNAAQLFADFIVSEDVVEWVVENELVIPILEGIEPPEHFPGDATFVRPELDDLTNNLESVIESWRNEFGV